MTSHKRTILVFTIAVFAHGCGTKPLPSIENIKEEVFVPEKIRNTAHIRSLLDRGLSPNLKNHEFSNQDWLITFAVRHGATGTVKLLLERGANVDARSEVLQKTPLFQAAFEGDVEVAKVLVQHGADVNAKDDAGNNSLREAISAHHTAMVEYLLKAGCDPNQRMREFADKHGTPEIKSIFSRFTSPL